MGFFSDVATPLIQRGVPVIPLRPKTKIAFLLNWEDLASTDPAKIAEWDGQYTDANCGSVAIASPNLTWYFEFDSPDVGQRCGDETHQKLPDTFKVRSSPGKGHIYFRQTSASIAMGNIAQGFVKGEDWSARVDRQYVVSPGSLHPKTGQPYEIRSLAPIIEAPDWFITWCISQKVEKNKNIAVSVGDKQPIFEGSRNASLTSVGGGLRHKGLEYTEILGVLSRMNDEQCHPPLSQEEVNTIAASVSRYSPGRSTVLLIGGKVAGTEPVVSPASATPVEEEPIQITPVPYPKFPEFVMKGTSIYEGLVKPFCDVNSRYPEFMWMPAMTILLNYLGTKVRIKQKNLITSIFMVSIGRRGKVIKSSSVEDAIRYFENVGVVGHSEDNLSNAGGRALVFTPASPEGLGIEMRRTNCKNAILYFDELKTLVNKASIESSTLQSNLLTLYESGKFQNLTKDTKKSYSLLPGTYCLSLIACSTDKNFTANWSKLAGTSTGLDDRFMFVLQPETLKPLTPYIHVDTYEASARTRKLIEQAISKGVYSITNSSPLSKFTAENDDSNRAEIRAEKLALGLAVDLGSDEIGEEEIERALAIVEYERSVKRYLRTYEASTREGSIQMELLYTLRKAGGVLSLREVYRILHPERMGTALWSQAYAGLIRAGWIREEGSGVKGDQKKLILLRVPEEDDD